MKLRLAEKTMKSLFFPGALLTIILSCQVQKQTVHDAHLDIENEQDLYSMATADEGKVQSPINILTCNLKEGEDRQVDIDCPDGIKIETITNTGHSVQLNFKSGSEVVLDDLHYKMIQAHFHTPSEHQVDGVTFPMEMHFVNQLVSEHDNSGYLVIAWLFKMGEANDFIDEFMARIPQEEHHTVKAGETTKWDQEWMLDETDHTLHYYYYEGSLTTPPFDETVKWLVAKKMFEASPEQIRYINSLEGNNARHVHALFNREIQNN